VVVAVSVSVVVTVLCLTAHQFRGQFQRTRLVGFHPGLARSAALAAAGALGWRLTPRRPASLR